MNNPSFESLHGDSPLCLDEPYASDAIPCSRRRLDGPNCWQRDGSATPPSSFHLARPASTSLSRASDALQSTKDSAFSVAGLPFDTSNAYPAGLSWETCGALWHPAESLYLDSSFDLTAYSGQWMEEDDCSIGHGIMAKEFPWSKASSSAQVPCTSYMLSSSSIMPQPFLDLDSEFLPDTDSLSRWFSPFCDDEQSNHNTVNLLPCDTTESPSEIAPRAPPFDCTIPTCHRTFLRHSDLSRHIKTMHITQEHSQRYRCAFAGCPKAGKVWTRLDSFTCHVRKYHKETNVQQLVRKSSRTLREPDGSLFFAITTPALMSRKRSSRDMTKVRSR